MTATPPFVVSADDLIVRSAPRNQRASPSPGCIAMAVGDASAASGIDMGASLPMPQPFVQLRARTTVAASTALLRLGGRARRRALERLLRGAAMGRIGRLRSGDNGPQAPAIALSSPVGFADAPGGARDATLAVSQIRQRLGGDEPGRSNARAARGPQGAIGRVAATGRALLRLTRGDARRHHPWGAAPPPCRHVVRP